MASISCITDLIFDLRFSFIDSTYLVERSFNHTETKATRCVAKGDDYVIKAVFDYSDHIYINRYALPEGHGMKFSCSADFKVEHGHFYSFEFCKTNMMTEHALCKILADSMEPGKSVKIETDATINLLFKEHATVAVTIWCHNLNTFVAKLKFRFPKTAGDEWFRYYMKYRAQIAG